MVLPVMMKLVVVNSGSIGFENGEEDDYCEAELKVNSNNGSIECDSNKKYPKEYGTARQLKDLVEELIV